MAHAYRSLEPGEQIIISDEPRPELEELARWESIDVPEEETADVAPKLTAAEKKAAKAEADEAAAKLAAEAATAAAAAAGQATAADDDADSTLSAK